MNSVEYFDYGITRTWLHGKRLAIIKTEGNMSRPAIDIWADLTIQTMQHWEAGFPMLIMHDLSSKNQGLTPYGMKRNNDIRRRIPRNGPVYIAVVFKNTALVKLAFSLIRKGSEFPTNVGVQIVNTPEAGVRWLEKYLPENKTHLSLAEP